MHYETRRQVIYSIRFGYKNWAIADTYGVTIDEVKAVRRELLRQERAAKRRKKLRQWQAVNVQQYPMQHS